MSDFGGGFSADYSISPYSSGYSNTGFNAGSYTPDSSYTNSDGSANYSLSNQNYGSSSSVNGSGDGLSLPNYGGTSSVGTNFTPYTDAYTNQGVGNNSYNNIVNPYMQSQGNYRDMLTDMMKNNYGGTDSGGNYIAFPRNYFPNDPTPPPQPAYQAPTTDAQGYSLSTGFNANTGFNRDGYNSGGFNSSGFNTKGLDAGGLDNQGLRYNSSSGRNYSDGGFNYDSGKGTTIFDKSTAASASNNPGETSATGNGSLLDATRKDLNNRNINGNGQEKNGWDLKGLAGLLGALQGNRGQGGNAGGGGSALGAVGGIIQNGRTAEQARQAQANANQVATNGQNQIASNNNIQQSQIKTLSDMYTQDSPYANQMRQELERKDAASGRRSQYGQREVELQAKLAQMNSANANNILGNIGNVSTANSNANTSILGGTKAGVDYGNASVASDGRSLSSVGDFFDKSGLTDKISNGLQGLWNNVNSPQGASSYWR